MTDDFNKGDILECMSTGRSSNNLIIGKKYKYVKESKDPTITCPCGLCCPLIIVEADGIQRTVFKCRFKKINSNNNILFSSSPKQPDLRNIIWTSCDKCFKTSFCSRYINENRKDYYFKWLCKACNQAVEAKNDLK